jgi:uncharacterized ion transporter superfamily protein YfcC
MMAEKPGAQISRKSFMQSLVILFVLMMFAGVLTRILPAGVYDTYTQNEREMIDPDSFRYITPPDYPVWRWFTAPIEVLGSEQGLNIIVIILFILIVGGSFAILDQSGILKSSISDIVTRFGDRKYILLLLVSLFFMILGAFFGILEEVVPLVPLMLALSYFLGWDSLVGLGMSVLATNIGFSAAITNPFTIGVAQNIAGLPLFSGAFFRIIVFITFYLIFSIFLVRYARGVARSPEISPVHEEDQSERNKYDIHSLNVQTRMDRKHRRAVIWFLAFAILILLTLISGPFITGISDFALPIVALLFLIAGIGAGLLSGMRGRDVIKSLWHGLSGIAPGILLILMAVSINYIVVQGKVMDTILHGVSSLFQGKTPILSAMMIFFMALFVEIFISSGSAKAFLLMPIMIPLADLVGITRQLTVTAYCFGDGFSNLAYPTNPILLIVLGLTVVSYPKWIRWTLKLWFWVMLASIVFLWIGVLIGYGPF